MLRLDQEPTFDTVATINLNGLQTSFGIRCRMLAVDRLDALQQQQTAGTLSPPEFIGTFLVGWNEGDVRGEGDAPMPFNPQNLERLLNVPGAALAVIRAFYSGYDEAAEKNSAPLPAGS